MNRVQQMTVDGVPVYFGTVSLIPQEVDLSGYSSFHVLVDTNTADHCLPLLEGLQWPAPSSTIMMEAGEPAKHLESCKLVWKALASHGADRRSLMINLGGGVVTDLGGFCAATYMRGMPFMHIPTTVLGMADATIGGKHGVNFDTYKNYVGTFAPSTAIWMDPQFLATLPDRHSANGMAEIIKHGCIGDPSLLDLPLEPSGLPPADWIDLLMRSVLVKKHFVENDPFEHSIRAALNFGHTIGHAFETFGLREGLNLLHGEAIALGMIIEAAISVEQCGLSRSDFDQICTVIRRIFPQRKWPSIPSDTLEQLITKDKKSRGGKTGFVLLQALGQPLIDRRVPFATVLKVVGQHKNT